MVERNCETALQKIPTGFRHSARLDALLAARRLAEFEHDPQLDRADIERAVPIAGYIVGAGSTESDSGRHQQNGGEKGYWFFHRRFRV